MMKWKSVVLVLLATGFVACKKSDSDKNPNVAVQGRLTVNVDNLKLKPSPTDDAAYTAILPKGAVLEDLGEATNFNSKYVLRGIEYNEPWLKVRAPDGKEGWVFAGAITFDLGNPSPLAKSLTHKRLVNLFGDSLASKTARYRAQYDAATRSREFAEAYRAAVKLREELVRALEEKIHFDDFSMAPDLFWLKEAIPGFVPQIVAEGTAFYFFFDYKNFYRKVQKTEGDEDDEFVELCLQMYPEDSIEYFFPKWMIQTWDYGGHSLLGRNIHLSMLEEMEEVLEANDMFEPEILKIKADLLSDITNPENTYWESQESILKELDAILASDFKVLSEADRTAVAARRKLFENPSEHGIQLDFRSGEHDF